MKLVIASLSAIALAATSAQAAEGPAGFDLWQSAETGKAAIAVAAIGEKAPFAAATGESKTALDILPTDEASLVIAGLRAKTAAKIELAAVPVSLNQKGPRASHIHPEQVSSGRGIP